MFSLLPLASFICFFLLWYQYTRSLRLSWIYSMLVWSLSAVVGTELFGCLRLLQVQSVFIWWVMVLFVCIILLSRTHSSIQSLRTVLLNKLSSIIQCISKSELLFVGYIIFFCSVTLLIVLTMPPTTWDAMTYHLPRIEHWIQNKSLNFYPTHAERQLFMGPFAEICMLQIRIFTGSHQYAGLIQWFAMASSLVVVTMISKQLGLSLISQIVSAVVMVTIPMGIVQTTSTQTDYVVSFWIVMVAYFTIAAGNSESWVSFFGLGSSIGLAMFSKGTAFIFIAPFAIWIGYRFVFLSKNNRVRYILLLLLILCINLPQWMRNFSLYQNPLGQTRYPSYTVGSFSPFLLASTMIKNVSVHLVTPLVWWNNSVQYGVIFIIERVLGVSVNDSSTQFQTQKYALPDFAFDEGSVGNFIHFILFSLSAILLFTRHKRNKNMQMYSVFVLGGFVLSTLLLRWQPWTSRLQLPSFVLASPMIAYMLEYKNNKTRLFVLFLLSVTSLFWLLNNTSHQFFGRNSVFSLHNDEIEFVQRPEIRASYLSTSAYIMEHQYKMIGLVMNDDAWEYPLWNLLQQNQYKNFRIESVHVENTSNTLSRLFIPDAILCISCDVNDNIKFSSAYRSSRRFGSIDIYSRQD
jgi:hypothetical protein